MKKDKEIELMQKHEQYLSPDDMFSDHHSRTIDWLSAFLISDTLQLQFFYFNLILILTLWRSEER